MADEVKTCANCGHTQATGVFCEVCGTKLPDAPAVEAAAVAASAAAPAPPPPPPVAQPAPVAAAAAPAAASAPPPPPPQQGAYADITGQSFWNKFFDLSFSHYITPSVIKVLFILFMVVIGLSVIGGIINGFLWSPAMGIFALIAGLIGGFVWLILARVFLELIMVFFNINRNTDEIAKTKR